MAIPKGEVIDSDGIGILVRGDFVAIVGKAPARLQRTKKLFDILDEAATSSSQGIVVMIVILPTADPPDKETREVTSERTNKLGSKLRRIVTIPIGDSFHLSIVRTVMRAMSVIRGRASLDKVTDTIESGIEIALEAKSSLTPSRGQILSDFKSIYNVLGESFPNIS